MISKQSYKIIINASSQLVQRQSHPIKQSQSRKRLHPSSKFKNINDVENDDRATQLLM
jgi:hypothetical protein